MLRGRHICMRCSVKHTFSMLYASKTETTHAYGGPLNESYFEADLCRLLRIC